MNDNVQMTIPSERDCEVLKRLVACHRHRDIASEMGISQSTVSQIKYKKCNQDYYKYLHHMRDLEVINTHRMLEEIVKENYDEFVWERLKAIESECRQALALAGERNAL